MKSVGAGVADIESQIGMSEIFMTRLALDGLQVPEPKQRLTQAKGFVLATPNRMMSAASPPPSPLSFRRFFKAAANVMVPL